MQQNIVSFSRNHFHPPPPPLFPLEVGSSLIEVKYIRSLNTYVLFSWVTHIEILYKKDFYFEGYFIFNLDPISRHPTST